MFPCSGGCLRNRDAAAELLLACTLAWGIGIWCSLLWEALRPSRGSHAYGHSFKTPHRGWLSRLQTDSPKRPVGHPGPPSSATPAFARKLGWVLQLLHRAASPEGDAAAWMACWPTFASQSFACPIFTASGRPRRQRSRALLRTSCRGLPVTWPDLSRFASGTSCRRDRLRAARGLGTSDRSRPVSWRRWPLRRSICVEIAVKKQSRTNARSAELGQARPDVRNA
jgi:hypothetical protein